jgi:hypothetical protein
MNTRNHGVVNVMDKVKEYRKRKNLEIPPCFKGNSFANLHADNLINMFGVNISLGSDIVSVINLLIY